MSACRRMDRDIGVFLTDLAPAAQDAATCRRHRTGTGSPWRSNVGTPGAAGTRSPLTSSVSGRRGSRALRRKLAAMFFAPSVRRAPVQAMDQWAGPTRHPGGARDRKRSGDGRAGYGNGTSRQASEPGMRPAPSIIRSRGLLVLVAGTGFEPATSGL
ncbi:hypothetical protein GCM10010350_76860 [Streptomyces galilaeus]|nr:hypothetical protein GCM10010350_76860 [Streptomyces galilaeus]